MDEQHEGSIASEVQIGWEQVGKKVAVDEGPRGAGACDSAS